MKNFNQHEIKLLTQMGECKDILGLLNEIELYNEIMPPVQKARIQKYLVDHLIVKLNTLFDNRKDVFSFERYQNENKLSNNDFRGKYSKIKEKYSILKEQVKSDRTKIAHNPNKTSGENQSILYNNLPKDEITNLMKELWDLVIEYKN